MKMKFKYSYRQLNDFPLNTIKLVVLNFVNKQANLKENFIECKKTVKEVAFKDVLALKDPLLGY